MTSTRVSRRFSIVARASNVEKFRLLFQRVIFGSGLLSAACRQIAESDIGKVTNYRAQAGLSTVFKLGRRAGPQIFPRSSTGTPSVRRAHELRGTRPIIWDRPGGLRTGSPPSPPPRLIRPIVRLLPRSPRLSGPGPHQPVLNCRPLKGQAAVCSSSARFWNSFRISR